MGRLLTLHGGELAEGEVPDAELFAGYLVSQGLADSTVRTYVPLCQRFLDHLVLVDADPLEPDPFAVRSWAHSLQAGRATLAQAKAVVGHWCAIVGAEDVSDTISVPRPARARVRSLSDEDASRMAQAARDDGGPRGLAVLAGLYTAARRSELASLAWPRIDLERGWLTLERVKVKDLHTVPLHPELAELLAARAPHGGRSWSWESAGTPWVFPGHNGGHVAPSTIWSWVKHVAAEAGVSCTPHQLRHTALTMANDRLGNLRAAQDFAGHASPEVTARYTRSTEDALRAAVGSLTY